MARKPKAADSDEDEVAREVRELRSMHFFRKQRTWPRMIWYNVVRGMAFGFGSLVGATVIVSLVIAILSPVVNQIDFIPLLSDWISKIIDIIEEARAAGG